ncbi:(2E,6E)-farnesyl diphosphate synthase [Haemophilus parainfluenzae]|jgi:geranyltranstransferase|uniref:(2E,6E)-farnesyl diphosphate synthase n=1 Tax=Haemophilus parainfluenzae TaxID=729 RepID=UPI00066AEEF0|nr:(2E,6E)-farnesyl diphosphate synthase [Haemophilus parainfluenzae]MDU5794240.1 (2E,6E)-farnesyl diphosphate synthase [Haemophilus parainfluenzae]
MSYQFGTELKQVQDRINHFLANQFEEIDSYNAPLRDAMKYGLLLGGKRVRPFLVYATGKMLGAEMPALDYAAAAIESIHAYSLIHDDLPAMDNDELRRGQPTCHIAFDEATAILAGDALQTFAFEILTEAPSLSAEQKLQLVKVLAQASGVRGMCLGQSLDLISEHKQVNLDELELIHRNKTGALLTAALKLGFICSPHFENKELEQQLERYSQAIGLAFQVQDDILDIEGDSAEIGKPVGSDLGLDKSTYPKLLGLEGAKQKAQELYQTALHELDSLPFDTTALRALAEFIVNRKS